MEKNQKLCLHFDTLERESDGKSFETFEHIRKHFSIELLPLQHHQTSNCSLKAWLITRIMSRIYSFEKENHRKSSTSNCNIHWPLLTTPHQKDTWDILIIEGNDALIFTVHDTEFVYRALRLFRHIHNQHSDIRSDGANNRPNKFHIRYFPHEETVRSHCWFWHLAFDSGTIAGRIRTTQASKTALKSIHQLRSRHTLVHLSILSFICF